MIVSNASCTSLIRLHSRQRPLTTYSLELHDLCRLVRQMVECVDVYRVGRRGNLFSRKKYVVGLAISPELT